MAGSRKWAVGKQHTDGRPVLDLILCLPDLLEKAIRIRKISSHIKPELLHLSDQHSLTGKGFFQLFVYGIVELPQFLFLKGGAAAQFSGQSGVGDQPSSQHEGTASGKAGTDSFIIRYRKNISVIDDRMNALLQKHGKCLQIRRAPVQIALCPGMDCEFRNRIAVIYFKDLCGTVCTFQANPCLYGKTDLFFQAPADFFQKTVQGIQVSQLPRPSSLFYNRRHGAAQIQIDLPIPHPVHLFRCPQKILCPVCQDLRDKRYVRIVCRINILPLPVLEMMGVIGCGKRRKIFIYLVSEKPPVHIPVGKACDSFERGKIEFHCLSLFVINV